jgi:hypothetical protein
MTYRDMSDVTRIQYLRSEIVVSPTIYEAATSILAAYIASKQFDEKSEQQLMEKAVKTALELAIVTDKIITQSSSGSAGIG